FHQGAAKESTDPDVIAATIAKPGVVLNVRWDPTGLSASTPNCPRTLARMGERGPRKNQRLGRRKFPLRRTRLRTGRHLKRTSANVSVASTKKPGRKRTGRMSGLADRRPSTRRKRLWKRRRRNMRGAKPRCGRNRGDRDQAEGRGFRLGRGRGAPEGGAAAGAGLRSSAAKR